MEVDFSRLPENLRPLAPLIRQYAASDDVEREERVEAASVEELQRLRVAPEGHWDAINAYLDENLEGPNQGEALVLESFAQAAMEAAFELERRGAG